MAKELKTFIGHGGQTRHMCPESACTFDSYDPAEVFKHWRRQHQTEQADPGPKVNLFDATGQKVEERELDFESIPEQFRGIFKGTKDHGE